MAHRHHPPASRLATSPPHLTFPGLSQIVRQGPWAQVSGQVSYGADGQLVGPGDPRAQAEQCLANLELTLRAAGMRLADVVKLTCYLTSAAHYDAYAAVKRARFPDPAPAATTVVVAGLLDERLLLEVEAVAVAHPAPPSGTR